MHENEFVQLFTESGIFFYARCAKHAALSYERYYCLKARDVVAFVCVFVCTVWFVLSSVSKSVNMQPNCHPAISSPRVSHPRFVPQTACNQLSQSHLRCYRRNVGRTVYLHFTVYDIDLVQHYRIKT